MRIVKSDIVIVGAGGAGLRAAIAAVENNPSIKVSLISKVYPMRSHTVAAEGGSAGVIQNQDSLETHFRDTVAGGEWLCDQTVVDYFVAHAAEEMVQLENWGCPWSRKEDGNIAVRAFGGMSVERTWFAADKSGFHILHTLFQTTLKYSSIERFDEYFITDILVDNGEAQGVVAIHLKTGEPVLFSGKSIILATGGAARLFEFNTNGSIVTADGHGMALRAGALLRDMEFIQYHPTGLPGSGILITEGARGEGGVLLNKNNYRYLQDYGLGPETQIGKAKNKHMELGPRDKLSQAFWHEQKKGNTIKTPLGDVVHLDLRHLGSKKIQSRLPMIQSLTKTHIGIDPVEHCIPVRPAAHYTMGGIKTDIDCATSIKRLYAVGECSSIGMHGANRLGSNSLAELVVFGKVAGIHAAQSSFHSQEVPDKKLNNLANDHLQAIEALRNRIGTEKMFMIRREMTATMEENFGIFRSQNTMQQGIDTIIELKQRFKKIKIQDKSKVFNTELLSAFELKNSLDIAHCVALAAIHRKESRGAHQRNDQYNKRDDDNFLKHSIISYKEESPTLSYENVNITHYPPKERLYGGAEEKSKNNTSLKGSPHDQ